MRKSINKYTYISLILIACIILFGFVNNTDSKYKCMIQMKNYTGEKAYVVVSLINPDDTYNKTLNIQGDDYEWFPDITNWWNFSDRINEKIDGITGATIGNGERNVISLQFNESKIDAGYKVRFESAVENQKYYAIDAELELNSATIINKVEGQGYIRYIRIMPIN